MDIIDVLGITVSDAGEELARGFTEDFVTHLSYLLRDALVARRPFVAGELVRCAGVCEDPWTVRYVEDDNVLIKSTAEPVVFAVVKAARLERVQVPS